MLDRNKIQEFMFLSEQAWFTLSSYRNPYADVSLHYCEVGISVK